MILSFISLSAAELKPFEKGDRIVFLGNSITDGGHYHSYIWLYYMTRMPECRISVFNGGIGGDTAFDMEKRLDNDIFSKDPSVLVITFGMNDSGYLEHNSADSVRFACEKYNESILNFNRIVDRVRKLDNTRIIMAGTSPYDEYAKYNAINCHGKDAVIRRIVDTQIKTAIDNGWEYIDWHQPINELNSKFRANDSLFSLCGSDRIHPDNDGHMVMAYLFLKAQGFVDRCVANIEIDAAKLRVVEQENCRISNFRRVKDGFSMKYRAFALPYPVDTIAHGWGMTRPQAKALDIIPFTQEMNQETLKVSGLNGRYRLTIDGELIGEYSSNDLANGINLAEITHTPQYQQALAVMHLNERRWEIERLFREFAWCQHGFFQQHNLLNADNREAINVMDENVDSNGWLKAHRDGYSKMMHKPYRDALLSEMNVIIDKIYEINKPQSRIIEFHKIDD